MATTETRTAIGFFRDRTQAERAIDELRDAGFRADQLGVASNVGGESSVLRGERGESLWDKIVHFFGGHPDEDYEVEDLQSPLEYAGVTREQAMYFEYQLTHSERGAIVTVRADGMWSEAEQIITRNGGDIGASAATFTYPAATPESSGRRRIQMLGEVLRIHKERVPVGEARLHKEVVTETQNVQVPTSHEELVIERRAGGEAAPGSEVGRGSEVRVPLTEERVIVEKRPVVREEVEVGKQNVEDTRNVSEQVRHEELRVDKDQKVKVNEEGKEPKNKKRVA